MNRKTASSSSESTSVKARGEIILSGIRRVPLASSVLRYVRASERVAVTGGESDFAIKRRRDRPKRGGRTPVTAWIALSCSSASAAVAAIASILSCPCKPSMTSRSASPLRLTRRGGRTRAPRAPSTAASCFTHSIGSTRTARQRGARHTRMCPRGVPRVLAFTRARPERIDMYVVW